ncbi:hypothetical protein GH714_004853 [Hevea brasiliensis]|uniref:indole-3-acetaldehyde oxidase n=1 Tax=Hevea brasiliensis TaxID=3981 RepID=A0A6A6LIL0_HEVBR|nr:hypothetical protein GH714_004853 [Hevea brasiliensis]
MQNNEEEERPTGTSNLVFAVNGHRFELSSVDASMTLLEFLRSHTSFKSVKLSCGEGGCGACIVLLSKYDPLREHIEDFTISSCLTLLCSINGCSITTTEGLGNSKDGFHSIHQRFTGFHASQCGFCTPGMCISLFGALVNAEKTDRPDPFLGFSKLTVIEAEKAIAGNLCRCTGYRPIADACKSFAADVDMEDLGFNSFWKKKESQEVKISRLPFYNRNHEICTFPEFLKREVKSSLPLESKRFSWYKPASIEELQSLLDTIDANNGVQMKIVVVIRRDQSGIEIGASLTISKVIEALKEEWKGEFLSECKVVFKKIAVHMEKIASEFIRNTGSVGGNLVMAQRKHFPSDIVTILLAAGSLVEILTGTMREKLTLEEFLAGASFDSKSVLLNVKIPNCESIKNISPERNSKLLFETYRAAPRPLGNALPYLNAAFLAEVSCSKSSAGIMLNRCQLAFGAFGTKHAIRAWKVEEFLAGKLLTIDILYDAIKLVKANVMPEDGTRNPTYRSINTLMFNDGKSKQNYDCLDHVKFPTLLSSARQVIQINKEYHPVGEPVTKSGAALQASGEAVYVDDIPSPRDCLHGAFIYSKKPFARVKGIEFNSKLLPAGLTALISFKDIPNGGENIGAKTIFGPEPLFADEFTRCSGERLALVVADTQKHADVASSIAVVDYDLENLDRPILTVEQAIKRSSLFEVPSFIYPKQIGDVSKGMAEADHKIISAENQTALAVPDEENCMVVYSSTQCPEFAHAVIAECLGVPEHNVRVITRRVGGAFGGKAIKAMPVATACALAAYKLQRPVRMYLNRKTDMIMAGGRHPMKITFSVCKTNLLSRSAMRAPGEVQGSYIAEAVIEHVASSLSMDADSVRAINLHTHDSLNSFYDVSAGEPLEYTLPSLWDKLATSSSFIQRTEMIKEFNRCNLWRKRGISRVPAVHEVMLRPTPGKVSILSDGSVVVEVGGIELGQGLWTKVKQMAAFGLGSIKCVGVGDLLDKVRVIESNTLSLIQGGLLLGALPLSQAVKQLECAVKPWLTD